MRRYFFGPAACALTCLLVPSCLAGCRTGEAYGRAEKSSPIYGLTVPRGYRDWTLISVAHEAGDNNDLRAVLGNDVAIKAYRTGTRPFPDGSVIARLAWRYMGSDKNNAAFGQVQSFVAGEPINVQFAVKNSRLYASTGGWGFAQFKNGVAADLKKHETCAACHQGAADDDFIFTRLAADP